MRLCLQCGEPIIGRNRRAKYCCENCKHRALYTLRRRKPSGRECACGCGEITTIATSGKLKGKPNVYIRGHSSRGPIRWTVDPDTGCWIWGGSYVSTGYGEITRDGERTRAHRFIYERFVGPIPAGLHLDHLCRNRACVNPDHLEPVTPAENIRRGTSKLTRDQVALVKASSGVTHRELAERFGVVRQTITDIKVGRAWAA